MQLAILKLNQAQYYFLTALGEKETALAAKNYVDEGKCPQKMIYKKY